MDEEYILVEEVCKDCGTTHEVLIKYENNFVRITI